MPDDGYPSVYSGVRATPVIHKGTELKSTTQMHLTRWLEAQGDSCKCEVKYSGDGGIYRVDIIATPAGTTEHAFVECKPYRDDMPGWLFDNRSKVDEWLDKMLIIRESEPNATLMLVPWNPDFDRPRQWFLNRGYRWRLIDEIAGSRVPW